MFKTGDKVRLVSKIRDRELKTLYNNYLGREGIISGVREGRLEPSFDVRFQDGELQAVKACHLKKVKTSVIKDLFPSIKDVTIRSTMYRHCVSGYTQRGSYQFTLCSEEAGGSFVMLHNPTSCKEILQDYVTKGATHLVFSGNVKGLCLMMENLRILHKVEEKAGYKPTVVLGKSHRSLVLSIDKKYMENHLRISILATIIRTLATGYKRSFRLFKKYPNVYYEADEDYNNGLAAVKGLWKDLPDILNWKEGHNPQMDHVLEDSSNGIVALWEKGI